MVVNVTHLYLDIDLELGLVVAYVILLLRKNNMTDKTIIKANDSLTNYNEELKRQL
jgi:hypothetical protein